MRVIVCTVIAALVVASGAIARGQGKARTLVAVWAHSDDEGPVAPILARYAREGVQVHMIIATDGAQGAANTSVPRGPEIARLREEEARCSAQALGIHPPILLGFPDGALGNYNADPALLIRVTQRVHEELQRLRPDVVITWGPDGGYGHPDHRIVSSIVTQLARAGAPGVPQRVFYASLPAEAIRAMYPTRGVPPFVIPRAELFTVRVPFTDADLNAGRRSFECQKTQVSQETIDRVIPAMKDVWKGEISLSPMVPEAPGKDLFR
ncbi:MAG TPA: PIG-L family deacetylase [Vicinamibacterales bacterium]|jgi:LmbE family N-acetylglucosaminyl deacetylase|nr:PIG-L family deacetylase [Vicinamibacterales bacterium]